MFKSAIVSAVIMAIVGVSLSWSASAQAASDHLVIAEVQVGGISARDEFVEIYNPTETAISLEGWRLSKRTASGNESNLIASLPAITLAVHTSLLAATPDGAFAASADVKYTTDEALAVNNSVILYGPLSGGNRPVVDLVGWGTASSREGTATPNPSNNQSIERKPGGADGNGQDTNDNAADFITLTQPTPQGKNAAARPAPAPSSSGGTETSGDQNGTSGTTDTGSTGAGTTSSGQTTGQDTSGSSSAATGTNAATSSANSSTTASNTSAETAGSQTTSPATSLTEPSPTYSAPRPTHVRINEFVSDPEAGDEWIELVNIGPSPVNLSDWFIEDGAETRTMLTGAVGVGDQRFRVIQKPKGQLNNSGDRIVLFNPAGNLVDAVTYGDWNDGKVNDNAPVASDPAAVARLSDGLDTNNDRSDFVRTEIPTPGAANIITAVPTEASTSSIDTSSRSAGSQRPIVVLNELFPNPIGDDQPDELIELANIGKENINLAGWRLRDELGTEYVIAPKDGPTALVAGGFLIFSRSRTGIALNNTGGETLRLFAPESERATSVAEYHEAAEENWSWARGPDGRWFWSTKWTPNAENEVTAPNRAPEAVIEARREATAGEIITFDASDSADPDRDSLALDWDFGDAQTEADHAVGSIGRYVYDRPGIFTIQLTVADSRGAKTTAQHRLMVRERSAVKTETVVGESAKSASGAVPSLSLTSSVAEQSAAEFGIRFSEILPNPVGSDEAEWIELENSGAAPAMLAGWTIISRVNETDVKNIHLMALDGQVIPARGFLILHRSVLRTALRNEGAILELRAPSGALMDSTAYERAREGTSWARRPDESWEWTSPTPGAASIFSSGNSSAALTGSAPRVTRSSGASLTSLAVRKTLTELKSTPIGNYVIVRGAITAAPAAVGKQIFFIGDESAGVQVFFGNRVISKLAIGDQVEVRGELREAGGALRLGISQASDISVLGKAAIPQPQLLRAQAANLDDLGNLVTVEGEVVEVRGRIAAIDDGSDEIRVSLPLSSENAGALAAGDTIRATGILSRTNSGYRILARSEADIVYSGRAASGRTAALSGSGSNSSSPAAPLREDVEVAALSGGGALLATSVWRRRRLLALAFSGARRIFGFMRRQA